MQFSVFPRRRRVHALAQARCVYSASLGTDESRIKPMVAGYSWTISHFPEVALYFCDGFLLETTYLIEGQPNALAKLNALNLSTTVLQQLHAIKAPAAFFPATVLDATSEFQVKRQALTDYATANSQFSASVKSDAESYVLRQKRLGRLGIPVDQAINMAISYVIFEVAAYAYFSELGFKIDAYVGDELPTLRKFVQGKFEQFSELEQRACITLRVS